MKKIIVLLLGVLFIFLGNQGYCASLSVNPVDGGQTIRFGRLQLDPKLNHKEIRIRIINSDGKQYQVFQRFAEPLRNSKGDSISDRIVKSYTKRSSNATGTLYVNDPQSIGQTDQLLYTSSRAGAGDTFSVVYNVNLNEIPASGEFLSKIQYVVRPVSSGTQQDVRFLNLSFEAKADLQFVLTTPKKNNAVELTFRDKNALETDVADKVAIDFSNNMDEIRIYQELYVYPQKQDGTLLPQGALEYGVKGHSSGIKAKDLTALKTPRTLIYEGSDAQLSFDIFFTLNKNLTSTLTAGNYQGRLKYVIQSNGFNKEESIDVSIAISPIFKMEIINPEIGMKFMNVLPDSDPQFKEIVVNIFSNLGKPYVVTQKMNTALINEKGVALQQENFLMKGDFIEKNAGSLIPSEFQSVKVGTQEVYFSDAHGSPVSFKMLYEVKPYKNMESGNYNTLITYSLGEK